jgi:hypothetical protein
MNTEVRYTYLSAREISEKLQALGYTLTRYAVGLLLSLHSLGKRKMRKIGTARQVDNRNEQFEYIAQLIQEFRTDGQPILSIDSKKKEFLGQLYRPGQVYCQEGLVCQDHDFPSLADGKVVPHGIFDLTRQEGYMHLSLSADTPEFACDCLESWWLHYGSIYYPKAERILILCDAGGSNNCNYYLFKENLQHLANRLGLTLRVAHYPSYCSKYNPIDHRLFPHVTRALQGVPLDSIDTVAKLINERASTNTGLKVFAQIVTKTYLTGKKVADDFKENMKIQFDNFLPKWNYWTCPDP